MNKPTTITVLGAGYVGLTTAALLAHAGYKVYALEPNPERLKTIKEGRSFFYEEGMDPIIKAGIDAGNLIPTNSYSDSVPQSQFVFSSVGTPDNPDGSSNLIYVFAAAQEAAKYLQPGSIYIQKSTVPVGTGKRVEDVFTKQGKKVAYVSNPEFLREGTAVSDTLYFDRIVAGGEDKEAVEKVLDIYRQLEKHRDMIAGMGSIKIPEQSGDYGEYIATGRESAELIKVTANAFLALKISFANSIAKLADQTEANITEVMSAVGADARIGKAFLSAGRGYGGGCFPKDVSGLIASGLEFGVSLDIMQAAQAVNESMPGYIIKKLKTKLDGNLTGKKIAVLGLAFKAGTSDARRSPGVRVANSLVSSGATVSAYDPEAIHEAKSEIDEEVTLVESIEACVKGSDAVIITTEWQEFLALPAGDYKELLGGTLFVDAINRFDPQAIKDSGLQYIGVGRS